MSRALGARLLQEDAVETLVTRLFPLATVITPNLGEAGELAGGPAPRDELARRLHGLGARAVVITGGHGDDPVETLFDGKRLIHIQVPRHDVRATHGAGCTHSATLAALLARGLRLEVAVGGAAETAAAAVEHGLFELGEGDGPVDVFNLRAAL